MAGNVKSMLAAANAVIDTITVQNAMEFYQDPNVIFIDIRDTSERVKEGVIPHAVHIPRGTLEFAVDPEMAAHNPIFDTNSSIILYCATGGRSTLAAKTLLDMGVPNVAHIAGGYAAWQEAGAPVEQIEESA